MAKFLAENQLQTAILDLVTGGDLRCAVAFWGAGAVGRLFPNGVPENTRIVCDLAMGGTNPGELRALDAPANPNLKHLPGLHAKVYLSAAGVIIASANASNNGIGFIGKPQLVEAGVFHAPGTEVHDAAADWFETIWERAGMVDKSALAIAQAAWERRPSDAGNGVHPQATPSLLDTVIANPGDFRGVGFVFTTVNVNREDHAAAAQAVIARHAQDPDPPAQAEIDRINRWPIHNVFFGFDSDDIGRWPQLFVCAHRRGNGRASYYFYERVYTAMLNKTTGVVLARRRVGLVQECGFTATIPAMNQADKKRLPKIFQAIKNTNRSNLFANGEELARFLLTLC